MSHNKTAILIATYSAYSFFGRARTNTVNDVGNTENGGGRNRPRVQHDGGVHNDASGNRKQTRWGYVISMILECVFNNYLLREGFC